ncbi:MAG: hypothetical protein OER95_04270, partial [Acidimicrobiia bacterium]|nr:hypothetical protein [Acidimicrobiia bacterium]
MTNQGDQSRQHSDDYASFRAAYEQTGLRDVPFETMSGVPLEPVYGDGPFPGQYPYTRGVYPSM